MNGYIFLSEQAEYAVEGDAGGFGTGKAITFTKDINRATIFLDASPWNGISNRHCNVLKKCHAIPATATRIVTILPREAN